jgi:hypothetical protein
MHVTGKLTGLLLVLLIGVVLGLQTAERGIYKVSGIPDQEPQTFSIKKIEEGKMEILLMGKQVQTAQPERMANYVSRIGMALGDSVKGGIRWFVAWIGQFFEPEWKG